MVVVDEADGAFTLADVALHEGRVVEDVHHLFDEQAERLLC